MEIRRMIKASRTTLRKKYNTAIVIVATMLAVSILPALASALICDCGIMARLECGWNLHIYQDTESLAEISYMHLSAVFSGLQKAG